MSHQTFAASFRKVNREDFPPTSPGASEAESSQLTLSPQLDNTALEDAVMMLVENSRPENTQKAYRARLNEFFAYCEAVYPGQMNMYALKGGRVLRFIFYQVMRGQKKRGGKKSSSRPLFDIDDYNDVMRKYGGHLEDLSQLPDPPEDCIGYSSLSLYRAVLKILFQHQLRKFETSLQWSQVWDYSCEILHKWVKRRKAEVRKLTYKEKVDHTFAPYMVAEHFSNIEDEIWRRGHGCHRSAFAFTKHRFCLLFSTGGILRCESIFKAELSDFVGLTIKKDTDVHEILLMIMQFSTGKFFC